MKAKIYLLLTFWLLSGCIKKTSQEEKLIKRYLMEKHGISLANYNHSFVIFISGDCGSCTEKTINFIRKIGSVKNEKFLIYEKIVVVPDNNAYVLDSVNNSRVKFIVDDGYQLQRYGVKFSKNMFLEFEKEGLIYQDWLYLNKIDTIALKYGYVL